MVTNGMETHEGIAGELVALLTERRDLCRQLSACAARQRVLIASDQTERLLEVLAERQQVLDRLMSRSARLREYQRDWPRWRATLGGRTAAGADALLAETDRLLTSIMAQDAKDAQLLETRRSLTARSLTEVRHGRDVGVAYATAGAVPGGPRVEWTDE